MIGGDGEKMWNGPITGPEGSSGLVDPIWADGDTKTQELPFWENN